MSSAKAESLDLMKVGTAAMGVALGIVEAF
jgi:hypothetical protein